MLYKALQGNLCSRADDLRGLETGPWVVDEWREITGSLQWDPDNNVPRNGLVCSDDILHCQVELTEYIAAVETDGQSIIHGKSQMWERMRITSLKAWPTAKSALVLDWAEGRSHDAWASWFPTEAVLYAAAQYTGQWADMLAVIEPVWRGMFTNNETIPAHSLHLTKGAHKLSGYTEVQEPIVRLAYAYALAKNGYFNLLGAAGWVLLAEAIRPGAWETVRGFTEDYWAGLPEV